MASYGQLIVFLGLYYYVWERVRGGGSGRVREGGEGGRGDGGGREGGWVGGWVG